MCPILELIQTLKECFSCHIYCAQLCTHLRAIFTSSFAVSNRESQYPRCTLLPHPTAHALPTSPTPRPFCFLTFYLRGEFFCCKGTALNDSCFCFCGSFCFKVQVLFVVLRQVFWTVLMLVVLVESLQTRQPAVGMSMLVRPQCSLLQVELLFLRGARET